MEISFVLPMYNEAQNLEAMVGMIRREAAPLLEDYEVVIVDDASTDGGGEIADRLARADSHIRVIHHPHNRGLGGGIRTGLAAARRGYVLYSDSDLPVDFACLRWVLPQVKPDTDLLIGYRLGRNEGIRRIIMSWVYNRLIRTVFGLRVRDVNFAFKLFRRDLLDRLDLRCDGSFIDAELLLEARRAGCRLVQVGLEYHVRQAGVSSLSSPRVVIGILRDMWRFLRREQPAATPQLVINADDFGLHADVNRAIIESYRRGALSSTSLLAPGAAFASAAAAVQEAPGLETGVHLALTQLSPCAPASEVRGLVNKDGHFPDSVFAVAWRLLTRRQARHQVEVEFRAQIEKVRAAGLRISHLDGHQHVHVMPGAASTVARLACEYGITAVRLPREPITWPRGVPLASALSRFVQGLALRLACGRAAQVFRRAGLVFPDRFRGFANAGRMDAEIAQRPSARPFGITEIGCHPGQANEELERLLGWGYRWREEFDALCAAPTVRAEFVSWRDCRAHPPLPLWSRALVSGARIPLLVWFGMMALLLGHPADPLDLYAMGVILAGFGGGLITRRLPAGWQAEASLASLLIALVGFALLANSAWVGALVAPASLLGLVAGRDMRARPPTRQLRSRLVTGILIILLMLCFEAKEERAEAMHAAHSRAHVMHMAAQPRASDSRSSEGSSSFVLARSTGKLA